MSTNNILIKPAENSISTATANNSSYIMPGVTADMLQKYDKNQYFRHCLQ